MNFYIPEWALWASGVLFVLLFWRKLKALVYVIVMIVCKGNIQ
jgi:hypothetical protein